MNSKDKDIIDKDKYIIDKALNYIEHIRITNAQISDGDMIRLNLESNNQLVCLLKDIAQLKYILDGEQINTKIEKE